MRNAAFANGIPTTVMANSTAANSHKNQATIPPPNTNQSRFPTNAITIQPFYSACFDLLQAESDAPVHTAANLVAGIATSYVLPGAAHDLHPSYAPPVPTSRSRLKTPFSKEKRAAIVVLSFSPVPFPRSVFVHLGQIMTGGESITPIPPFARGTSEPYSAPRLGLPPPWSGCSRFSRTPAAHAAGSFLPDCRGIRHQSWGLN